MLLQTQKIALNPNNKQATRMAQHCGYARVAYNFALSAFKADLEAGEWRSLYEIKREFNAVKREKFDWCSDLSQSASKNAIHNFNDAVQRWKSKQNSFPVHKKRSDRVSYQADNGVGTVEVYKNRIHLPKIGWVRMREELRFNGEVSKVVVSRRNDRWFVSILVHCDAGHADHQPLVFDDKPPIGIDVGINTLATCSDGTKYENPRALKRYKRKLRRANKSLSRKMFLSKNWQKAKKRLGAVHYRIANIRKDAHHKASTAIVRSASAIGIETLNIRGLLKNSQVSQSTIGRFTWNVPNTAEIQSRTARYSNHASRPVLCVK